jgi:hypothetical protein
MSNEIYTKAVVGLSGLVDVIMALETEAKETRATIAALQERIRCLENTQEHHKSVLEDLTMAGLPRNDSDLETLIDDRVESALDMRLDDAIESALSGREIEVTLSGSVTL